MSKTLYVTDAGSVSLGGALYVPGMEIPIERFKGRESSLRELVATGKLSQRRRRLRTDDSGRVIKIDRSSGAAPLPGELSEYDAKRRREVRPLKSELVGQAEISTALETLRREQADAEVKKANEAADKAAEAEVNSVPVDESENVSEEEKQQLEEIADGASQEEDEDVWEDAGDELFEEDAALVDELSQVEEG